MGSEGAFAHHFSLDGRSSFELHRRISENNRLLLCLEVPSTMDVLFVNFASAIFDKKKKALCGNPKAPKGPCKQTTT
jgi:hypothetical protein